MLFTANLFAENKGGKIELTFKTDSTTKLCIAKVTKLDSALKGADVKFFVKRLFNPLPIGKSVSTNKDGIAEMTFPNDIPGDSLGNIIVIAKIEDDDNVGTVEKQAGVAWGVKVNTNNEEWEKRSWSAARDKAPNVLIFVSIVIFVGVWGTLFFVCLQTYKIFKISSRKK